MKEKRFFTTNTDISIRSVTDEQGNTTDYFSGYAIVFDRRSVEINDWNGTYYEIIKREAVESYLNSKKPKDIVLTFNHNLQEPLARYKSTREQNNLTLTVDERGLLISAPIGNTQLARDVKEMIQRGDVDGMSFIFTVDKDGATYDKKETEVVRTINSMSGIYDVSVVTFPAYQDSDIAIAKRSIESLEKETEKNKR